MRLGMEYIAADIILRSSASSFCLCPRKSFEDRKQAALAAVGAVKSSVYKMQEQRANQEKRLAELGDRRRFLDEERSALAHELIQGVEKFKDDINKVQPYNRPHPAQ
jgi:hypothetical protein